ncbi:metallophosphoesterase family protein [Clostridium paridis]|uniref:Metallophosphoesterase n=1 Tax=Clostridium paridis TaxID=2803863 RepID=A0A937FGB7_9CLOT|nr:metallophosphoesterase [Clostridium paridis]MBL4932854.1 metallophosphoesterase [Clostridium paridis]
MDLVFAVISDTHIKSLNSREHEKLKDALIFINSRETNIDALVVAGDITNMGTKRAYKDFKSILDTYINKTVEKILVMGNHDYLGLTNIKGAQKRFYENTGEKIHSHKIIKGYHFISISTEGRRISGVFGDSLKKWLSEQLKLAHESDPKKPIFLTVHQSIKGTVYGSSNWGNRDLYKIIEGYPQVIIFSGHSHHPVNDERAIHQQDFTSVSVGSTSYVQLEGEKLLEGIPSLAEEFSQGLMVNVENNQVRFSILDFSTKCMSKDKWIIEEPSERSKFKYTEKRKENRRKPYFSSTSEIEIRNIGCNWIDIKFTQARHEDFVHSYIIKVIDVEKEVLVKETRVFSDYYLATRNLYVEFRQKQLRPNRKYMIIVKAIESFGNESEDFLSLLFVTRDIPIKKILQRSKPIWVNSASELNY